MRVTRTEESVWVGYHAWSDARLPLLTCWRRWIQQRPPPCRPHGTSEIGACPRAHARSRGDGSGGARQDAVDAVPDGVGVNETDEEMINTGDVTACPGKRSLIKIKIHSATRRLATTSWSTCTYSWLHLCCESESACQYHESMMATTTYHHCDFWRLPVARCWSLLATDGQLLATARLRMGTTFVREERERAAAVRGFGQSYLNDRMNSALLLRVRVGSSC